MKLAALCLIPTLALALLITARRVVRNRAEIRHRLQRCGHRRRITAQRPPREAGCQPVRPEHAPHAAAHIRTQSGHIEPELLRMFVELGVLILLLGALFGWLAAHEPRL